MLRLALLIALLCCSLNEQSPFAVFPLSRVIILFSKSPIFSIVSALLLLDSFPIVVVASRTCFIRFRNSVFVSCCSVAIDSSLSSRCSMLLVSPTPGVSPFLSFFRLALSSGVGIWLVVFLFVPLSLFSISLTIFSTLGGDGFGILQFLALRHLLPLFSLCLLLFFYSFTLQIMQLFSLLLMLLLFTPCGSTFTGSLFFNLDLLSVLSPFMRTCT